MPRYSGSGRHRGTTRGRAAASPLRRPASSSCRRRPPTNATTRRRRRTGSRGRPCTAWGSGGASKTIDVAVPDQAALRWRSTAGGGQVATFELLSPGAAGLRAQVVFEAVPAGTEVRVYDPDAPATTTEMVPLTAEWREELATGGAASVWTPTVAGDLLAVEFYLPRGAKQGDLRFSVPRVSHLDVHPMRSDDIGRSVCGNHVDAPCRSDMISSRAPQGTPTAGCAREAAAGGAERVVDPGRNAGAGHVEPSVLPQEGITNMAYATRRRGIPAFWCAGSQIPSRLRCACSPLAALRLLPWGLPLLVGRALPATKMRYPKDKAIRDPAH